MQALRHTSHDDHLPVNRTAILLALAAAVLSLAFTLITIFMAQGSVNDDTYITMRFARNLAEHGQFTYNLGHPTYSFTSPAWTVLVASLAWLGIDYVAIGQIAAILLTALSAVFFYKLSRCFLPVAWAPTAVVLLLLDPYLIGAVYCGTELALFTLLSTAYLYRISLNIDRSRETVLPAILLALLVWTRPEGVVIFGASALYMLATLGLREGFVRSLRIGLLGAVLYSPWLVYAAVTFKTIIPTSIILKSLSPGGRVPFTDVETMLRFVVLIGKAYAPHMLLIAATAFLVAKKSTSSLRDRDTWRPALPAIVVLAILVFYAAGMKEKLISSRYLVTMAPLLALLTVQALAFVHGHSSRVRPGIASMTSVLIVVMSVINVKAVESRIRRAEALNLPRLEAGRWLAEHIPEDKVVFSGGVAGAVAYHFRGHVWDLDLISEMGKDIELAKRARMRLPVPLWMYAYKKPDYLMLDRMLELPGGAGPIVFENSMVRIVPVGEALQKKGEAQ